jgi:type II secretory pathway component PulJ
MANLKLKMLATVLMAAVLGAGMLVMPAIAADEKHDHAHDAIMDAMEAMNKAYKKLKPQIADASKNASSLELISEMQKQTLIAKGNVPGRAAKTPTAQRAKFVADYRKSMIALMGEYLKLETAIIDGNNAEAEKIFANLNKLKEKEHEKFQEE